jgi:hypothetical protein
MIWRYAGGDFPIGIRSALRAERLDLQVVETRHVDLHADAANGRMQGCEPKKKLVLPGLIASAAQIGRANVKVTTSPVCSARAKPI